MLYISILNEPPEGQYVWNINAYFRNKMFVEWMNDDLVREMVKDVDKTEVIRDGCLKSSVLGYISPEELSSGVKMLICLYKDPSFRYYRGALMGDNCYKWVLKIAEMKDIYIHLGYSPQQLPKEFTVTFTDSGLVTHTRKEFRSELHRLFDL